MATKYRLPSFILNGAEVEVTEERPGVNASLFQINGINVWIGSEGLTEVKPPLPEEPPNFSTVRVGSRAYVRDDPSDHLNWYGPDGRKTWAELVAKSMESTGFPPVLLAPDPFAEPVVLPLRLVCAATKDDTLEIAGPDDDHQIRLSILGLGSVYLDQRQARTAARALWTAADAAEKEQS